MERGVQGVAFAVGALPAQLVVRLVERRPYSLTAGETLQRAVCRADIADVPQAFQLRGHFHSRLASERSPQAVTTIAQAGMLAVYLLRDLE